ncbi:MAG: SdpI family protein [Anaerolineae bacterium]|nr:SdpI family protein [Anaerolineae bacterium]
MEDSETIISSFMILFVSGGLLAAALAVPMVLRFVKPNPWYGFRTAKTLADEDVWYKANAYSGKLLFATGLSWVVIAVALRYVPGVGTDPALYNAVVGGFVLLGLVGLLSSSFAYLRSL